MLPGLLTTRLSIPAVLLPMSHVNAFRSHLMQQFVAQSSRQMRPPLALTSVIGPLRGGNVSSSTGHTGCVSPSAAIGDSSSFQPQKQAVQQAGISSESNSNCITDEYDSAVPNILTEEAQLVQNIIISRRTTSNYAPKSSWESSPQKILMVREAIIRAIRCAIQAPNHRRTEPWTFKTLIYPSTKRQALLNLIHGDKRERWDNVPAFVVALVHGQPNQDEKASAIQPKSNSEEFQPTASTSSCSTIPSDVSIHRELPLIPPSTLQQMEDVSRIKSDRLWSMKK